jgi:pyruvate dehydrogenase E2 component (dihydrolipoamide acetyltransferase)
VFASPSTRALARELGVDIGAVEGSGPGGRVTGADVHAHTQGAETPAGEESTAGAATASAAAADTAATTGDSEAAAAVGNGTAEAVEQRGSGGGAAAERDRTLAMPATRQLAADLGVDLNAVPASEEREGEPFVTPEDVRAFAAEGGDGASGIASGVAGATTTEEAKSATEPVTAADERAAAEASDEGAAAGDLADRPGERIPYRGVRRTIGEQMAASKYTAPHVSHHDEFDATDLVELQSELAAVAEDEGVKLTYLPFVVKAITTALAEFPYLNASLDESAEEIVLHDEYNVGIAVATDAGLMVPVVKHADEKGLKQLAEEIRDLAERARNREIKPEEMQGGTFTITNIGVIGGEFSSPIINHPEAAIFAMGPIKKRPWVVDDEVVARNTMRFSMSVDHRLVDGADAARFSNRVKELLADPSRLLLE